MLKRLVYDQIYPFLHLNHKLLLDSIDLLIFYLLAVSTCALLLSTRIIMITTINTFLQVKTFVSKLLDDGRTKQEVTKHLANVHDNVRSYVSKYRSATTETEPREATHRQPNYERNVHYFCTAKHGVQVNALINTYYQMSAT